MILISVTVPPPAAMVLRTGLVLLAFIHWMVYGRTVNLALGAHGRPVTQMSHIRGSGKFARFVLMQK